MNILELTCYKLAKDEKIPHFNENHAKVTVELFKYKKLNKDQLARQTYIDRTVLRSILAELEYFRVIRYIDGGFWVIGKKSDALQALLSIAEIATLRIV